MSQKYYEPTVGRKELFNLMRIKFPKGKKEKQFEFCMGIHPDKIDYYIDLFKQYK